MLLLYEYSLLKNKITFGSPSSNFKVFEICRRQLLIYFTYIKGFEKGKEGWSVNFTFSMISSILYLSPDS